jgi:NitT/TauT family transport system permease protein
MASSIEPKRLLLSSLPLLVGVVAWELIASASIRTEFLFGRPSSILGILTRRIFDGTLPLDTWVTLEEAMIGFLLGNFVGVLFGLALWRWGRFEHAVRPYLIALGAVPVFALGPVLVVWFGTGLLFKVILVFLSTVIIATFHAHAGATEINPDLFRLFRSWRVSDMTIFKLLILPSATAWVLAGLRLNIGFAILGAFIGEFISSEVGLAHRILVDAGLYNISAVWAGVLMFALMALMLHFVVAQCERMLMPWKATGNLWNDIGSQQVSIIRK